MRSYMDDSSFGVQSLADTIGSTESADGPVSSNSSYNSENITVVDADASLAVGHNSDYRESAHLNSLSIGHHFVSTDQAPALVSSTSSPSPSRLQEPLGEAQLLRRGSMSSSIDISQPLTPLKMSPNRGSAAPSTPRSGSPKSFRLSDEEGSVADESNSQAIQSSIGEEDEGNISVERMPQLVMPSLAMPARRPFTEQGRYMGRARIMFVGPKGVGKTSLIQNLIRSCEHIIYVDPETKNSESSSTKRITEILASTRCYPPWRIELDSRRTGLGTNSIGDGVLERNLTLIDTPGIENDNDVELVLRYLHSSLLHAADWKSLSDGELTNVLSGDGGTQIDAVIYVFDPALSAGKEPLDLQLSTSHRQLLHYICKSTNFIPLIGRADSVSSDGLRNRKEQLSHIFDTLGLESYRLTDLAPPDLDSRPQDNCSTVEPFAISSAQSDNTDVIDASILMSSQYIHPLVPSELDHVISSLFSPSNIARMKHFSAYKFISWRREKFTNNLDVDGLHPRRLTREALHRTGTLKSDRILEEPSKVLVSHGSSSFYRSTSPSASNASGVSEDTTDPPLNAMARYNEHNRTFEPFRQFRLARWAQDLQRSLDKESRRYKELYHHGLAGWNSNEDSEKRDHEAMISSHSTQRPARGRLGGDLGVIDPRDPLGVLAFGQVFRQRGLFALRVAGGCGLLGALTYWLMKNWADVQEFFGFGQPEPLVNMVAVPAPTRSLLEWWNEFYIQEFLRWGR